MPRCVLPACTHILWLGLACLLLFLALQEAHVFSSSDGYALQVFVVTSPQVHEEVSSKLPE